MNKANKIATNDYLSVSSLIHESHRYLPTNRDMEKMIALHMYRNDGLATIIVSQQGHNRFLMSLLIKSMSSGQCEAYAITSGKCDIVNGKTYHKLLKKWMHRITGLANLAGNMEGRLLLKGGSSNGR